MHLDSAGVCRLYFDAEGLLYDVDDITQDRPIGQPSFGPFPSISVLDGISAMRFADVEGEHEWIAGYRRDDFNYGRYTLRQVASFHRCGGRFFLEEDQDCLQADECELAEQLYLNPLCKSEFLRSSP